MNYEEYLKWVEVNCPKDFDEVDFVEFLASRTAVLIDEIAKNKGQTTEQILDQFFNPALESFYH